MVFNYVLITSCFSQSIDTINTNEILLDVLFNYYNQEGDHAAVTGGTGSEHLDDYAGKVIIYIPLDSNNSLTNIVGLNHYTSASSDRINANVSSASSNDFRGYLNVTLDKKTKKGEVISYSAGGSVESDYMSSFFGFAWNKQTPINNKSIGFSMITYFDKWLLYFPDELRPLDVQLPQTDRKRTFQLSFQYQRSINRKMNFGFFPELIYQQGLLSTPFHRVYFISEELPKIEKLPEHRIKLPLALRFNYYMTEYFILKSYYRFYADNFGIISNTIEIEFPIKLTPFITLSPVYRFYKQSESKYFNPFKQHSGIKDYYTSDYDLSTFTSHSFGGGFNYEPLYGIFGYKQYKKGSALFKKIGGRLIYYRRSDGLKAVNFTFHSGFSF